MLYPPCIARVQWVTGMGGGGVGDDGDGVKTPNSGAYSNMNY